MVLCSSMEPLPPDALTLLVYYGCPASHTHEHNSAECLFVPSLAPVNVIGPALFLDCHVSSTLPVICAESHRLVWA
jgi:hypothetical protein